MAADTTLYREAYRPVYHFSPAKNWTNDPNGLLYYDGEYHLFYQYNPEGIQWGHMSWGHAVSTDLLHWQHLPLALPEYNGTMVFSGSAVVDKGNTSGLCEGSGDCMVAIYTAHRENEVQTQALAFSSDRGRTFTRYSGNPVLDLGKKDFRDPKVFRYEPGNQWIMSVSLPNERQIQFYASADLKKWDLQGTFGPLGDTSRIWECPDLFPLPVAEGGQKWVLLVSGGHPVAGSLGMQYFVGDFDGRNFVPEANTSWPKWVDYGHDYYAAVTWNDTPDGRRLMLGWVNNWQYANDIPTDPWRGMMAVPRELSLRNTPEGYRLVQQPIRELAGQHGDAFMLREFSLEGIGNTLLSNRVQGPAYELQLELSSQDAAQYGVEVFKGAAENTRIGYDREKGVLFIDRTSGGKSDFHANFAGRVEAPLRLTPGEKLNLQILLDHSVIEVFAQEGMVALTQQVFPTNQELEMHLFSDGGSTMAHRIQAWPMKSVWR
mgnify:FL=1